MSLRDMGKKLKCIIIGGGLSVLSFDFDRDLKDYYIICCNNHLNQMANMIIYYDSKFKEYFKTHFISRNTLLIGFKHKGIDYTSERCDYYYTYNDIEFGDTGFHALQFADKVFNFKEIYLIGYDYYLEGKKYHVNDELDKKEDIAKFVTWSIGNVLSKYATYKWNNKIYNCNERSRIQKFKYKLP